MKITKKIFPITFYAFVLAATGNLLAAEAGGMSINLPENDSIIIAHHKQQTKHDSYSSFTPRASTPLPIATMLNKKSSFSSKDGGRENRASSFSRTSIVDSSLLASDKEHQYGSLTNPDRLYEYMYEYMIDHYTKYLIESNTHSNSENDSNNDFEDGSIYQLKQEQLEAVQKKSNNLRSQSSSTNSSNISDDTHVHQHNNDIDQPASHAGNNLSLQTEDSFFASFQKKLLEGLNQISNNTKQMERMAQGSRYHTRTKGVLLKHQALRPNNANITKDSSSNVEDGDQPTTKRLAHYATNSFPEDHIDSDDTQSITSNTDIYDIEETKAILQEYKNLVLQEVKYNMQKQRKTKTSANCHNMNNLDDHQLFFWNGSIPSNSGSGRSYSNVHANHHISQSVYCADSFSPQGQIVHNTNSPDAQTSTANTSQHAQHQSELQPLLNEAAKKEICSMSQKNTLLEQCSPSLIAQNSEQLSIMIGSSNSTPNPQSAILSANKNIMIGFLLLLALLYKLSKYIHIHSASYPPSSKINWKRRSKF